MYEKRKPSAKVQSLDNQYIQKQTLKSIEDRRQKLVRATHKRRLIIMSVVFGALILFFGIQIMGSKQNSQALQVQAQASQTKLNHAKQKNQNLKLKVRQLNDTTYLEKLIRERYYYSKSGEIIFSLPGDKPSN